jgi:hypothetical protein
MKKMKKISKNFMFSALSLTALLFVGCENEPALTGQSTIEVSKNVTGSVMLIAPLAATQTVNEGNEGKYQYTLDISNPQPVDIYVKVKLTSGTATRGEDFDFDDQLLIKAYNTSVTGNINIISDLEFEPAEDFTLEIAGDINISNAAIPASTISFTITNYVGSSLEMSFAWDKSIDGYPTGSNIDFDIFVADAAGYDNNDPFATANYTGYAATGDEPESFSMDLADWADGEYILFHDLWYNGFYGYGPAEGIAVPIVATFVRAGAFTTVVTQDPSQTIDAGTTLGFKDDDNEDTGVANNGFIAKVTIANGVFTVADYSGTTLASGKTSGSKRTSRPNSIVKN